MSNERRREARIPGSNARYFLKKDNALVECKVVNLSRLGLGIEIPTDLESGHWEIGNVVEGTLVLGESRFSANAQVRVIRGNFVGLEYDNPSGTFIKQLISMLSPAYVAHSIFEISKEHLGPDVEAVFHGDEFEAVVFKAGRSNGATSQVFVGGEMLEFSKGECRLVPSPLVRSAASPGAYDFLAEFSAFSKSAAGTARLARALDLLKQVVELWTACPEQLRALVDTHHTRICRKT